MSRFTDAELEAMDLAAERREASAAYHASHPEDSRPTCCGHTLTLLPDGLKLCCVCEKTYSSEGAQL